MAEMRLRVFDRRGTPLGELRPEVESATWLLNGVGRLRCSVARSDAGATAEMLRFGNLALAEFDNGLPSWGGVIEPPRQWAEGTIGVEAYSGEYLLGFRMTSRGRYFSQATVGYIFRSVIEEANASRDTLIDVGEVWAGGGMHSPDYHFRDLLSIARESIGRRLTPADFVVEPVVDGAGRLRFRASLYERRGRELAGTALVESNNLGRIRLIEQGPLVNRWALVGEGTTWGDERPMAFAEDEASMGRYGLREGSEVLGDVAELPTLEGAAAERLRRTAWPQTMLELEALDAAPGRFADYDVGDVLDVLLHSYGFEGYAARVRVTAREWRPAAGVCGLVVREVE